MGWTSWYSFEADATETDFHENIQALIAKGFFDAGYISINLNEGWIKNRSSNGSIIYDDMKYPSGMINLGEYIHNRSLRYGMYSCRGTKQCGSPDPNITYIAPGSFGYYLQDAKYFANAGADYLKFDSCSATQQLDQAIEEYSNMSQYLNQTGRPIYYDLCAWNWYFGINGGKIGNSWRMCADPNNWNEILNCMQLLMNGQWKYGNPYGWNNAGELYAENKNSGLINGHQTSLQARAQFSFYAAASSDLVVSDIINDLTDYDLETYLNIDVINVNQDLGPMDGPSSGYKIYGTTTTNSTFIFGKQLSDGSFVAVFINSMDIEMNVTCDEGCFLSQNFNSSVNKLQVKDLWNNKSLTTIDRINDYSSSKFNGILEMAMCTGSDDQLFEYDNNTNMIKSTFNNGYLQTYNCDNYTQTLIVTSIDINMKNNCNGKNGLWNVDTMINNKPSYCMNNTIECVTICNKNYNNQCLYIDTINGNNYGYTLWNDATIREMKSCDNNMNIPNKECRCLQIRPYIGQSSFNYTVNTLQAKGGVSMLQLLPILSL